MKNKALRQLVYGAVTAALYVVLTELSTLAGISSGIIQFRLSEMLCVLPAFFPSAIPALTIGCLISNILAGATVVDMIFGTLATLIGAIGAYLLRRYRYLIPLPTVAANVIILPFVLRFLYDFPWAHAYFTLTIFIGEAVCAYALGILLHRTLYKHQTAIFR